MDWANPVLQTVLPQLGASAIFLVAAWKFYSDNKVQQSQKDDHIRSLNLALQELYIKNAELLTQLRDVIENQGRLLEKNTHAISSLEKTILERK